MKKIAGFIAGFLKTQWNQYTPFGQLLFALALAALAVDAAISYEYGVSMTRLHGLGFALVAITFCILPDVASMEWSKGNKGAAMALALCCVPLGVVAYQSHIGYGAGVRVGDMQQTGVTNAKFDDARESLKSERANLDMWRKQLADLEAQNAWATTVTADSLRAKLPSLELAIAQEAKRGGCGPKCLERTKERDTITAQIATTEKVADLGKRIEATQRILDGKTTKAASADFKSSTVVNQNGVFAKLYKAATGEKAADAIQADAVTQEFVSIFTAGSGALAFMMIAPLLMFAAGRNRKEFQKLLGGSYEASERPAYAKVADSLREAGQRVSQPSYELKDRGRVIDLIGAAPA